MTSIPWLKRLPLPEGPYFLVMGYCVIVLIYGYLRFPDQPIIPCTSGAAGFCGSHGQPENAAAYHAFVMWQQTLFISWPFGMISAALLYVKGRQRRKARLVK